MRRKRANGGLVSGAVGLGCGLLLGLLLLQRSSDSSSSSPSTSPASASAVAASSNDMEMTSKRIIGEDEKGTKKKRELLYVGVMTARKYLGSRAKAVYDSWGAEVPGKIYFYSSEGSDEDDAAFGLPLVALPRVDDSYPPQKKSFLMLQHMWQRHGDDFEWYMRADDDLYVRADRLEKLLRSVDSSRPLYVGQAGRGNSEEFGLLSLEYDENFCMGGPGVLLSRETLKRMVPHIKHCLANLYTSHEDVELGRCVRRFAGISCTWSYEMQSILYHNSSGDLAFTGKLKSREVHRAISLHPVKSAPHMYRLHNYMRSLKIQDLQQERLEIERDIDRMTRILANEEGSSRSTALMRKQKQQVQQREDEINAKERGPWDFFSRSEFSLSDANPRRRLHSDLREGLEDLTREVMASINACSRQRGRFVEERQALYGYRRRTSRGVDTVLDLLLIYKKYRGRKITLPVRRHLYLHQHYTGLEWRYSTDSDSDDRTIHFIVPVSGRSEALRRFVQNYERVCLQDPIESERSVLIVVLYSSAKKMDNSDDDDKNDDDDEQSLRLLNRLKDRHGPRKIRIMEGIGNFSRARALDRASKSLNERDLMFFVDVDIRFAASALFRLRRNCVYNGRAYFPVVFSQYDPRIVGRSSTDELNERFGFWRIFGYGIVGIYKKDYDAVGGLDLGIEGWGKEDVDLFERVVRSDELEVFRSADVDLVHIYHGIQCDKSLDTLQSSMCKGTRADTYAGREQLARIVYDDPAYLEFARVARLKAINGSSASSSRR